MPTWVIGIEIFSKFKFQFSCFILLSVFCFPHSSLLSLRCKLGNIQPYIYFSYYIVICSLYLCTVVHPPQPFPPPTLFKFTANLSRLPHLFSPSLFPFLPPSILIICCSCQTSSLWLCVVRNRHMDRQAARQKDKYADKQWKQYCIKRRKSRLRCEDCEGLIEVDQSRRVSGTPYF